MQLTIRVLQCYVPKARPYAMAFLTPVSSKQTALGRAFGTFQMQLTIRVLQCYVPKARPYAMAFLTMIGWLKARDKRREARYVYIPLR